MSNRIGVIESPARMDTPRQALDLRLGETRVVARVEEQRRVTSQLRVVATIWRCRTTGSGNISNMRVETWRTEHECELGLDLDLPAMPCLLADIRSEITALLLPGSVLEVAQLLLSELVANSMRHAGLGPDDRIRVRAEAGLGRLRVDVFDGGRAHKPPLAGGIRPNPGARSGWGLYLVDTLATRWGNGVGWHWFELDIDEPPA